MSFPDRFLGYAASAFFGGRTSAHIRKEAAPVVYTDFLSMYPTVNSLMGLWSFVIAGEIEVIEHCQERVVSFLKSISVERLFQRETWRELTAFVRVIPDGDVLPARAKYSTECKDWQVGVNYLYGDDRRDALWFTLPDVAASVILTGKIPTIVDAFRIIPKGKLDSLVPIKLRGAITIDPANQDFFKVVIEERKRLPKRMDLSEIERQRLDKSLKVLANAASYGIYAEMIRDESDQKVLVNCHGIDSTPFECRVSHPDEPGEFCFPPMASLITGAARLMLALLEKCVTDLGGTYAMEDTDSMAIVATKTGGEIQIGNSKIKALSWKQVRAIANRFLSLNPYDRTAVRGSILKIEDHNFDPKTGKQRQIHCFAISAKRYVLFLLDHRGLPELLKKGKNNKEDSWSEHGLGHLLNPSDPDSDERDWISHVWLGIVRKSLGLSVSRPKFYDLPAIGRVAVTSPVIMCAFSNFNENKPYKDQIKPFNFLLSCQVERLGHPIGVDPQQFHLIAPYDNKSRNWLKANWIDQYSGNPYEITTTELQNRRIARVKAYGDLISDYEFHPESKCADENGNLCKRQTVGLLKRRHIRIDQTKYIGKESNSLEEVESGLVHSERSIYTEYEDKRRDEWETRINPALKRAKIDEIVKNTGMSRRAIINLRAGRSRPHRKNRETLRLTLLTLGFLKCTEGS